jgi:phosphate acetyltransferase
MPQRAVQLPGPGTIYVGQQIRFLRPVYIGDCVTATVKVCTDRPTDRSINRP